MNKQIILERKLDFNQFKNVFITAFLCFFITLIFNKYNSNLWTIVFGSLFIVMLLIMLLKKGIVVKDFNSISLGYFLFGKLIKSVKIHTKDMPVFSNFTVNKRPNYNYTEKPHLFSRWEPNLEYRDESHVFFLLDKNHRVKKTFLNLSNRNASENAYKFLVENSHLIFEKYNPI